MKFLWLVIISFLLVQDEVPLKANDEFELKIDLQFKQRPKADVNTVELDRRTLPTSGMNAPYLYVNLRILKPVAEELRVKVMSNKNETLLSRKFDPSVLIKLDLGFTDDIKDRAAAHQYIITFLNKEKAPLSKVEIFFEEDGTYIVNGQKRGKI
jgi:hypothetical protein